MSHRYSRQDQTESLSLTSPCAHLINGVFGIPDFANTHNHIISWLWEFYSHPNGITDFTHFALASSDLFVSDLFFSGACLEINVGPVMEAPVDFYTLVAA